LSTTLVVSQSIATQLHSLTQENLETAGVLLVRIVPVHGGGLRLLGREFHAVPEKAYLKREVDSLTISSNGYVEALARAEKLGCAALWVHSHPGIEAWPWPSVYDQVVDAELSETFRIRSASECYGALILSPGKNGVKFTGHFSAQDQVARRIDRLWEVADRYKLVLHEGATLVEPLGMYNRNVRAFGPAIQVALGELTVGIVGCGGTGSAVAEQLVRLGVRKFVLLDPQSLTDSNVTRVYGSSLSDVDRPKVDICADNIRSIAPSAEVEPLQSTVTVAASATRLTRCDVVFGCTDDNAGRLVLSRLSTYFLLPVIDCGVLISSEKDTGEIIGIDGRVTVLSPGSACLICRERIDMAKAQAEFLTPEERKRREDEGYAPALGNTEPAVVTFTTLVAATAVTELLERLIGYGPRPRPSEVLLRCHEREISTNLVGPSMNHYCHPAAGKLGLGFTKPFLEMAGLQ
jgi:molybdopterin/thiamine biosynthesis adenylyltransferase